MHRDKTRAPFLRQPVYAAEDANAEDASEGEGVREQRCAGLGENGLVAARVPRLPAGSFAECDDRDASWRKGAPCYVIGVWGGEREKERRRTIASTSAPAVHLLLIGSDARPVSCGTELDNAQRALSQLERSGKQFLRNGRGRQRGFGDIHLRGDRVGELREVRPAARYCAAAPADVGHNSIAPNDVSGHIKGGARHRPVQPRVVPAVHI